MDILYCGIITEKEKFNRLLNEIGSMPFAQTKLEHMILDGFAKDPLVQKISVLSTLPVPRYPKYSKLWISMESSNLYGFKVKYNSFMNLPVLKQLTTFISNVRNMANWARKTESDEKRVILIYGTNPLNSIPAFIIRRIHRVPVVAYVTEIDSLRLFDAESMVARIKNKIYISLSKSVERSFDGYLLLSGHMSEKIEIGDKPVQIVEGMVSSKLPLVKEDFAEESTAYCKADEIIYAGTLNKRYGIENLVRSFLLLNDEKHKLVIYGRGDYQAELEKICLEHPQVIYRGAKTNEEVVEAEKNAKLLINPRPSEEMFTRFSFPSKILEYMTTGTPCLITRLEGIPLEYYDYCYAFMDESIEGMAETLKQVLETDSGELKKKGLEARKFVLEKKNNNYQTQKISAFFQEHFS